MPGRNYTFTIGTHEHPELPAVAEPAPTPNTAAMIADLIAALKVAPAPAPAPPVLPAPVVAPAVPAAPPLIALHLPQFRVNWLAVAVVAMAAFIGWDHFRKPAVAPAPAPVPAVSRVTTAATAVYKLQPTAYRNVKAKVVAGTVTKANIGEALTAEKVAAATELANAIGAAPDLATALEETAKAMEGGK